MPNLSIVVAMAANGVIGKDNAMPWHIPAELRRFRELTWGHPILMGRLTHESIGRALPGRRNMILTRNPGYQAPDCEVFTDLAAGIAACDAGDEVMVIGGEQIYRLALPDCQRLYLTLIDGDYAGDARFPEIDPTEWAVTQESVSAALDRTPGYTCRTLDRRTKPHR